jgi:hypothetical protein
LQAIFGEGNQFNKFARSMKDEIRAADTKAKVLAGSRTDINVTDDLGFIDAASDAARRGVVATTIDRTIGAIAGAAKNRYIGLNDKNAKRLAQVLTNRELGIEALEKIIRDTPRQQQPIMRDAVSEIGLRLGLITAVAER